MVFLTVFFLCQKIKRESDVVHQTPFLAEAISRQPLPYHLIIITKF